METILLLGVNYKSTGIALREKISADELTQTLYTSYFPDLCKEFAILATCNRIEILLITTDAENGEKKLGKLFKGLKPYIYRDRAAVNHFYEVASGLDSMIVGESEILSQVRQTYTLAKEQQTVGPILHQLLKDAIRVGKLARHETKIATGVTSLAHAAIVLAKKDVAAFPNCRLLVIGAGTIAERIIQIGKKEHINKIIITNRTQEKAQQLAELYGITAIPFTDLEKTLIDTDVIISATASPNIILSVLRIKQIMEQRPSQSLYMVDLAVPRDIEPKAATIQNVHLHNIDELQKLVDSNIKNRNKEVTRVRTIIEEEVNKFQDWYYQRKSIPILTTLQNEAEEIRNAELDKALRKLAYLQLNEHDKQTISILAKRIGSKLLAKPIRNIKRLSLEHDLDVVKEVFELQSS